MTPLRERLAQLRERKLVQWALLDESLADAQRTVDSGANLSPYFLEIAAIHALRGEPEQAYSGLERLYDSGCRSYRRVAADPIFASLRGQSRFAEILDRMRRDVDRKAANVARDGLAAGIDSMIAAGR